MGNITCEWGEALKKFELLITSYKENIDLAKKAHYPIVLAAAGLTVVDVKTDLRAFFFLEECGNRLGHLTRQYKN